VRSINRGSGILFGILLVFVLALTAACSDDEEQATATPAVPAATATVEPVAADDEDVEAGRNLYAAQCAACHTVDGTQAVGPTWQGLYGSEVELESGETVTADEEYIEESIREPNAEIHAGYPANVMPSYDDTLTDEQIEQLIAYIRTLE
jgi:mono/diheme cytochrome c family protein